MTSNQRSGVGVPGRREEFDEELDLGLVLHQNIEHLVGGLAPMGRRRYECRLAGVGFQVHVCLGAAEGFDAGGVPTV